MKHTILNTQHNSTQYTHHTMNTTIQQTPCFVNPILNTPYKKATQKQHNTKTHTLKKITIQKNTNHNKTHTTTHTNQTQHKKTQHNKNTYCHKNIIQQQTQGFLNKQKTTYMFQRINTNSFNKTQY